MPKAVEIKKGDVVNWNNQLLHVKYIEVQSPSARGAATLYKMRFRNIQTGLKVEQRFKGDEIIDKVELFRKPVSYSYDEGEALVFMDDEDYSQYTINKSDLEEELLYITEAIQGLAVLIVDDQVVGVEMPQSVELEIKETAPAIKGGSVNARTKPAEFETGLIVQIPEYLAPGEKIKISTSDKKFLGRAD